MAIDRVPALKRCRALGLEPAVIGRSKESKRQLRRTNRKVSVRLLAKEADWYMIEYKAGFGSGKKLLKTAWIHASDVRSLSGYQGLDPASLPEFNIPGRMSEQADLHDDLDRLRDPLYTLWEDQEIEFLGYTRVNNVSYAYIETSIFDQPARGFVPLSSIQLDEYEVQQLMNMVGK